jgi:hypothetical protein
MKGGIKMRINPKRSVISNRITRRAVTRGVNQYRRNKYNRQPVYVTEQLEKFSWKIFFKNLFGIE